MHRMLKASSLGIVTALLGALVYFFVSGFELEEHLGLDTLFKIRGPIDAPDDSVVVAIDKVSSDYFGLENDPAKWPRHYHAKLIETLTAQGAKAIVFDVFFKEHRNEEDDNKLASAIKKAGNVILFSHLKREILSQSGKSPRFQEMDNTINIERLVYPIDNIAVSPVALAPFALPKYPQQVTRFWTFRVPAGEIPNMPVMAFQLATLENYLTLRLMLQKIIPDQVDVLPKEINSLLQNQQLTDLVSELRRLFKENKALAKKIKNTINDSHDINEKTKHILLAMVKMYHGPNQHYLNYYGPPRSITTIPYYKVISADKDFNYDVKGKVVFVGFSEFLQPEQKDNFYTVFSQKSGLDISGVEIAATAFTNLLNTQTLKTLTPFSFITLIMLYGFVIAFACRYLNTIPSVFAALLLATSYALMSYVVFQNYYLWLPWVVPLLIQSPFAVFVALLWHYIETRQ